MKIEDINLFFWFLEEKSDTWEAVDTMFPYTLDSNKKWTKCAYILSLARMNQQEGGIY